MLIYMILNGSVFGMLLKIVLNLDSLICFIVMNDKKLKLIIES